MPPWMTRKWGYQGQKRSNRDKQYLGCATSSFEVEVWSNHKTKITCHDEVKMYFNDKINEFENCKINKSRKDYTT